ncbi:MAG TPA: hypothetical protein VMX17_17035 [Candidatus Glassbacteria bacterium]|nr:hypothetical protein [Candidatus Glassbacteria bacterium]
MDEAKRKKLNEIDYKITRICDNCRNSALRGSWGVCFKHNYEHQKHTESNRQLSIHRSGTCKHHEFKDGFIEYIHKFAEFITFGGKQ